MARDPKADAALALHRFGLGPRLGSIAAIASDPRGALLSELDRPGVGGITDSDLLSSGEAARAAFDFREERKAQRLVDQERERQRQASAPAPSSPPAAAMANAAPAAKDNAMEANAAGQTQKPNAGPGIPQQIFLAEAKARINAALGADLGFVERLVWFWSNHFCISADKGGGVRALAGAYEREAIRPHVRGDFGNMLLAVESHPAMLLYLDNARSIGPDSVAGINQHKGLNENLAREILELHTLGVRTVYAQEDVTNFAKVITGWTVVPFRQDRAHGGEFTFNPRLHEPEPQTVIGKVYPDLGLDQGRAVLADLARHPATAKHVAGKLARYFVADQPAQTLVDHLAKSFLDSNGNLKELARALVTAPEAWTAARSKLKPPGEWIVAALRATGVTPPDIRPVMQAYNMLGMPLWRPSAPKGFSADSADWIDGLSERLDVANELARRVASLVDPQGVVDIALGPLATAETRQAIARAESRPQALALLLMASEFQRS